MTLLLPLPAGSIRKLPTSMKKTLLIAAIALIGTSAFAQADTDKQSEKVTKYVTTFPNGNSYDNQSHLLYNRLFELKVIPKNLGKGSKR